MSVKIELNEHSADDIKTINELKSLGFSDEEIQDIYDRSYKNKTCGRCKHDGEFGDIPGSSCYLCKRNPEDHRIDWWEEKK